MKIYLDNNLGVSKVDQEELTQDTYGYNILKVYIPNAVLAPYDTFTCYYGALLQNGRKVGWFAMEARTSSDADYEANYTLYKATIEQCVLSVEGKVYIGCQVILGNSGNATLIKKNTAVVQFNVRKSVAINNDILILDPEQTNTDVLESYKNLLENALTTYATKAQVQSGFDEVNNKLDLKTDKSDTYTKQEVNKLTDGLSGEIDTVRKSVNSLNTRTSILENTVDDLRNAQQLADVVPTYADLQEYYAMHLDPEDKVQVLSDDTHDGDSTVYKWDGSNWIYLGSYSSNTYNKNELDNLLNDKADKSNTYNKTEVDGKFDGVGKEFETLSNDILSLQTSVSDLKSVQNVVDVVPTYAALQKYDASKVETYDKIQVIADETHDGASTIYNRLGNAWQYVGAFGTNSYTKTEVDTKLSTKADKDDTYTKTEVDDKLGGYIKNDDTTYSATVRGKEVVVQTEGGYNSTSYQDGSIHRSIPRTAGYTYTFPEKDGTFAMTSDIPTVNDPTITFTQGGVTKGSISLNQATDQTIDIDAGGSGGGSTVIANPTLSGDEATLDGLEVDGTKYKVGGGSGTITLDAIVDKNGNNRFLEGTLKDGSTGASIKYKKWSLSGSHLMIVLVGTVSSNLTDYTALASVTFPEYIQSKIRPLGKSAQLVSVTKGFLIKDTEYIATEYNFNLKKVSNGFRIVPEQAITISETYNFRIQFDLLIDTD